ncbi:hypothetical protein MIMGU_mgv1a006753mg [Erythranthe guttata]|uniref:TFIIS N-terminal domain-containing protein n=1 Tax=Erythranthe guttata TaxID=4155 RepID=A0A022PUX3_ERYGU|nr:hypothetical protein MIMGU_mgv1a006753mg [Erythranthe guttata]
MANASVASLDKWREYFRSANSNIFGIIEHAIMVAASDCPYDFKLKRDRIAEMLFACKMTKCFGCDRIELAVPNGVVLEKSEDDNTREGDDDDDVDDDVDGREMNVNHVSNYSYGDAEALTDEIEEESQLFGEVLRIKEIVDNYEDESDSTLFESLRRLQLMPFSVETLKATEIGKSVNGLRRHGLKDIRDLARRLIEDWKVMVDSWVNATAAIAAIATESVKTSTVEEEEEGLPSPPLDEGAFFATPSSMELSQFFDGMDEDGNPQNNGELNKNRGSGRNPNLVKTDARRSSLDERKERKIVEEKKAPEAMLKRQQCPPPSRTNRPPPSSESGPGRPKPAAIKPQANNNGAIQRKPMPTQQEKLNSNNEPSVRMKLEAAKRKLQERYQEAENAKKQRTIQVVELRDLPKQNFGQRNQHMRPANQNRNRPNVRR